MDYRNADGSPGGMFGNGLRVLARYLVDHVHLALPCRPSGVLLRRAHAVLGLTEPVQRVLDPPGPRQPSPSGPCLPLGGAPPCPSRRLQAEGGRL
ncbi:hypothetical protein ACFVJ4_41635 [Streptomyces sp. NPDC127178]|uniref:hypothetical protein n=1 Tax=unclassified Streptomyces TaxID=2593676 RepID=UPI003643E312